MKKTLKKIKTTLVVPTIREHSIKRFINEWRYILEKDKVRLIIVEDNPEKSFEIKYGEHYAWEDIEKELGDNSWIIPRRTGAVRNYGLLKAVQKETDMIVVLDDDCYPLRSDFFKQHHRNLYFPYNKVMRWVSTDREERHVRGLPYKESHTNDKAAISHGTWDNIPDMDAVHQLAGFKNFEPYIGLIPRGIYFPFSAMNYAVKPKYLTLTYQVLTGQRNDGHVYPFNRFDDIWAGIIAKKICDHLGVYISTGEPQIYHDKASNPFTNLKKEAPGIGVNEYFWKNIDSIKLKKNTPIDCYTEVANYLVNSDFQDEPDYFRELGIAMDIWAKLIKNDIFYNSKS